VVAAMLEQLDVRPGDRILEIGAGTGYNAALLAELAGPAGHVVTVDIDEDVVRGARTALAATGYANVRVICADGAQGYPPSAPFNRIIITAGAWDLCPAWWDQLAPAGRVVVPLRITAGTTRSVAFDLTNGYLASTSMMACGFVPMRGSGAQPEPAFALADGVTFLPGDGRTASPDSLTRALSLPATRSWTGILIRPGQPFTDLDLWLATTSEGFCRIVAEQKAVDADTATPAFRWSGAAITNETDSLAYLTMRPTEQGDDTLVFELGVRAHGPGAGALSAALIRQISRWDKEHHSASPRIDAHLKPSQATGTLIIDKPHTQLAVTW
jgi:protein-L-isoaspartate(D-aspartate) O-methyltransferase